jgi:peptidoglycan/xylan/chitin deacetylase (PgdA/CDA1 family)
MPNLPILANIPIIAYHKISDQKEFGLTTTSPGTFEKQIRILSASGFTPLTFKDIGSGAVLPEKPVIITFDDGYESVYRNALPIMANHGFKGIVYIITDYINKYNTWEAVRWQQKFKHLSKEQIVNLHRHGFEIGSHGRSHHYLPALSDARIRSEAGQSKEHLEDMIGETIVSFCYPYGRYTERVKSIIRDAGYAYAIRNLNLSKRQRSEPLAMMRRSIYLTDSEKVFREKVNLPFIPSLHSLEETIIQKGAYASILINRLKGNSK